MSRYSIDSRTLNPGDTFIPVKGARFDGHDFIPDAIKKGAKVLDVDLGKYAAQYRKKLNCHVIGVTGSAGKTTVKDLLYAILSPHFKVVKTQENLNNEFGVPLTILSADHETEILIVEMAMRQLGEIDYLTRIVRPSHMVITNIGITHLETLKTEKNIAKAKAESLRAPLNWEKERVAFLNHQSPFYDYLKNKAIKNKFKVLPFGGQDKPEQNFHCCRLIGRHFGLTDNQIHEGIKSFIPSQHRLDVESLKGVKIIDDSYNANPDGVVYALQYCSKYEGRKILVLGDMLELGPESKRLHQDMVQAAIDHDFAFIFTFGKETKEMRSEILSIYHFDDKQTLQKELFYELKPGDVVLIKGSRGLKMEEVVEYLKLKYA